jgi:molybdenum cofactor cytidylyltransferase
MGCSLRCGVQRLMREAPNAAGAIVMLCDQPYVSGEVLRRLAEAHASSGKAAVACSYAGTFGPPCLFGASRFEELLRVADDRGAKSLLAAAGAELHLVPFPEGSIDFDTPADVTHGGRPRDSGK